MFGQSKITLYLCTRKRETNPVGYLCSQKALALTDNKQTSKLCFQKVAAKYLKAVCLYCNLSLLRNYTS